jgi:hypothetical protein
MSLQITCSASAFVHSQLGSQTPCPSHAGAWRVVTLEVDCRERCVTTVPTADMPWPFTHHEYARLLLLRSRIRETQGLTSGTDNGSRPCGRICA